MHILIVTDRYAPEVSAASTRLQAHAQAWRSAGHDVTVLTCAPNFPRGKIFDGYRNSWVQSEDLDGIRVVRVWTYMAPNSGVIRRSLDYASFVVSAVLNAKAVRRPDVILASSPPITVAFAGALLARRLRTPWVFEVRDLWPASIRAVGVSKSALLSLIEALELRLYADAARVIVLTEPFRDDLTSRAVPPEHISVVTNGIHAAAWASEPAPSMRAQLNLRQDAFVVGFIGTVGLAQGAAVFVRAAERLAGYTDIEFLCLGEGADRPAVEALAEAKGLRNIIFRDFVPFSQMPAVLSCLDLGAVLLKDDPVFDTVLPSKLFELMAAGVPVVASAGREVRRLLEASAGGLCVPPENDELLARSILDLKADGDRRAYGERGRAFVRTHYDRTRLAGNALDVLIEAAGGPA